MTTTLAQVRTACANNIGPSLVLPGLVFGINIYRDTNTIDSNFVSTCGKGPKEKWDITYNITFEDLLLDEDEFGEVDLFLRCVSEKLGDFDVQRLVCQCKTLIDLKESTGKQKYLKCVVLGEATLS